MCLAIPGRVVELVARGADGLCRARVAFGGIVQQACLAYVPDARPGDYVIVHAGFAIARLDEAEAARTLAWLEEVGLEAAAPPRDGEGRTP